MAEKAVQITDIQKSFGTDGVVTQVLFDITQDFNYGELSMVVGPSGCGKTTLISIIGGILNANSGEINVFGERIDKMDDKAKTNFRKDNIGFIFQQFNLIPTLTVSENVSIPLLISELPKDEIDKRTGEILDKVRLGHRKDAFPKHLSGGEQQRVAIARSLIQNPKLVICDEPTASLDSKTGHAVLEMIKNITLQDNKAVIVVTHDTRIFEFADRMITLDDGRIVSDSMCK